VTRSALSIVLEWKHKDFKEVFGSYGIHTRLKLKLLNLMINS